MKRARRRFPLWAHGFRNGTRNTKNAAAVLPITTSPPLTFTWDNGAAGPRAAYSWTLPGRYTLAVTAANRCGEAHGSWAVQVWAEWPYQVYLPAVYRE